MRTEAVAKIAELARASGVLRPRDLQAHGIARQYLRFAEQQGLVIRSRAGCTCQRMLRSRNFYTFAEAAKRVPRGVICLLSALRFHNIGTQNPFEGWMAIGEKDRRPRADHPRIRIVRFCSAKVIHRLNIARKSFAGCATFQFKFLAHLENARIPPQVDIGFGDAVTPGVLRYSTLLLCRHHGFRLIQWILSLPRRRRRLSASA